MIQVRVGHLTETETVDLGLDLAHLRGGGSCPTQFWGETRDGREVYIRYRGGGLSIDVDGEERVGCRHGPAYHGAISMGQACDLLGLTVMGERLPVTLPDPEKEWSLPLGPGVVYWSVHVSLTQATVAAVIADLADRWPDAVLRGWEYDRTRPDPSFARDVPIAGVAELPSKPFCGSGSVYGLWQDGAARGSGQDVMIAGQAGVFAARMSYEPWTARRGWPGPNPRLIQASEAPEDLPVLLPPEGQQVFTLEMSARLDHPISCANLEAVDAVLARHLGPVTGSVHYEGHPDETWTLQTWAGQDMVDWCARSPHHACTAQKGRAQDRELVWTWTRVTA